MKKIKDFVFLMICVAALALTSTQAWMLFQADLKTYKAVNLDYSKGSDNSLSVVSQEIQMEVYYYDEDAESYVKLEKDSPFVISGFVPNDTIPFRIRFINNSAYAQSGYLAMSGVSCTLCEGVALDDDPLGYFLLNVTPGAGYRNNAMLDVSMPEGVFRKLSEGTGSANNRMFTIYSSVGIPINDLENSETKDDYSELDCCIWFDSRSGNEFQGAIITIENFFLIV